MVSLIGCEKLQKQIQVINVKNYFERSKRKRERKNIISKGRLSQLKGKFSSGIEGALASTLNRNFNWEQLSEMIRCIFLLMFSKFIWVTLLQKQQKYK